MSKVLSDGITGIIFDLDGTLYVCDRFADEIHDASSAYIAELKQISRAEAGLLMAAARLKLEADSGTSPTISAVCSELGGVIQELHRFFVHTLRPEAFLLRDERVIRLLERLSRQFSLYVYTNNNHSLTARIMNYLGLAGLVRGIFAIDDTWRPKPDEEMVQRILEEAGLTPEETLFVGDRFDVDLRMPEQLGCPVYLSQSIEQLLRLEDLLTGSATERPTPPVTDTSR